MWQTGDTVKWQRGPCVCTGARHSREGWHISRRTGTPCSTGSHDLSYHIDTSCAPSHGTAIRHTSNHVHYIRWLAAKKRWQRGVSTSSSLHKQTITSTQPDIFTLTFWSLSETFISRSLFSSSSSLSHSHHYKALNSLICGDVPLRIYSLTHSSETTGRNKLKDTVVALGSQAALGTKCCSLSWWRPKHSEAAFRCIQALQCSLCIMTEA